MTMPFSKMVDTLSESMHKCKDASDLNKKVLAAEELSVHAGELGAHTARFTRIAWILTMLFLFLAILVFEGVLLFEAIETVLPPEMHRIIESVYYSSSIFTEDANVVLSDEVKLWLYCISGLVAIPAAFDVILAAKCRRTPVTVGKTAAKVKPNLPFEDSQWVWKNLDYVAKTLDSVRNELNPGHTIPFGTSLVLCILFLAPAEVMAFFTLEENILIVIIAGIICFLLCSVPFCLILILQLSVLTFFFTNRKSIKQAEELRREFLQNEAEYKRQCENARWHAREELGKELYAKATAGGIVDRDLLAQAAEKGNPQANLLIGKRILRRVEEEDLTSHEMSAVYKEAKEYLQHADRSSTPEGIILYAYTRLQTEWHNEYEWTKILRSVRMVDKAKLTEKYRRLYDEVEEWLIDKVDSARLAAKPSIEAVIQRMNSGSSGFGSGWDRMNDDLDAVQHAGEITRGYGEDWTGYDPETFPDSDDIW